MFKKEYYRLDELAKRFDVTFDDVRYSVESGALKLAFHLSNKRFVLGNCQVDKGFIAFGIARYNGLVSISENKQLELVENGRVKCRHFTLLQKSNITQLELEYPFKSPIPNKLLAEWQPKSLEHINWDIIPAILCPSEQKNTLKVAGQSLLNTLAEIGKQSSPDVKVDTEVYDKFLDYQFVFADMELDVNHSCVLHNDIERLGIVGLPDEKQVSNTVINKKLPDEILSDSATRSSQLAELIGRILLSKPKIKTIEVWRKLREEVEMDFLDRKFDVEDILKDITPNELLWQSRYGTNSSVKRSVFDSKVSRIRTKLGINKR
jgi:hypothetical protein